MEGGIMATDKRVMVCPICNVTIEVRWAIFASDTLSRHIKAEHK
jgi:hypothetical protein